MTTAPPPAVTAYLDAHRKDLLSLAAELIGYDTQNPPGDTDDAIGAVADICTDLGLDPVVVQSDVGKPNLLVRVEGASPHTLLFNGHLDTVPFDADEWTHDPLGELVDDRLYGRGSTDMKGAVAAMLHVLRAYVETDTTPPVTLAFAFVSDEEVGGNAGLPELLSAVDCVALGCVIGENTCKDGRHSVTVADRGSIWLTVQATGEAAHGSRPMLGENAIDKLYDAVDAIRDALSSRPLDIDPAMAAVIEDSVSFYTPELPERDAWELFEFPTVNLGYLQGGDAINAVPETATAKLDVRVTATASTRDVLGAIEDTLAGVDGVEIVEVRRADGTFEDDESAVATATVDVAEAVADTTVFRRSATGGGDAKVMRNAGVPTVEFAFGQDNAHAVDEYTTVAALEMNARAYAGLPVAFASRVAGGRR